MRVLVIMHVENEGPGVFGELLQAAGAEVRFARLYLGDALPAPSEIDAALSLGGPMNVYEEERYPFLRNETGFLQAAAEHNLPVLGICLGAQMIAKAAGAAVTRNRVEEVGWSTVSLTGEGLTDPLFRGLPPVLPVFQWHGDTFAVPEGGALLATGDGCHNQAFRFRHSYGLQFHLEADRALLSEWFTGKDAAAGILRSCDERAPEANRHARTLFTNFLAIAGQLRSGDSALCSVIEQVLADTAEHHPGIIAEAVVARLLEAYEPQPRETRHREQRKNHAERVRRLTHEVYRLLADAQEPERGREIAARVSRAFLMTKRAPGRRS